MSGYSKDYYIKYKGICKADGLCVNCRKPAVIKNGKKMSLCAECLKKRRTSEALLRDSRKAQGICVLCGKNPSYGGRTQCFGCLTKRAKYYGERYHRLKEENNK